MNLPGGRGGLVTEAAILERAARRLLVKFHRETDCGAQGMHWAECEALADALGLDPDDIVGLDPDDFVCEERPS